MTAKDLFEKFGFKLDEYETQTNNAIVTYTRGEGWMKEKNYFSKSNQKRYLQRP